MDLTESQKESVRKWVAEGYGLSELQRSISSEYGIPMTYMDVRFLVIELGLQIRDKASPAKRTVSAEKSKPEDELEDPPDSQGPKDDVQEPLSGGSVTVEVDRITRSGSVASGTVTFSDGVRGAWWLDQHGRLALDAQRPGYRPPQADLQAFQMELSRALEKRGF